MHKAIKNALRPVNTLSSAGKATLKQITQEMRNAVTAADTAKALAHFADRIETELGIAQ